MADKVLLVKFGEIAMRGDNQYIFINRLILAIRRNLDPVGNYYVVREPGRLIVEDRGGEMDYDLVIPRVEPIFGLVALCPVSGCRKCPWMPSKKKLCATCKSSMAISP